ncbi:hypothetical protein BH23BAC1_BH23BAC1_40740 [soil metagenome]
MISINYKFTRFTFLLLIFSVNLLYAESLTSGAPTQSKLKVKDVDAQLSFNSSNLPIIFINTFGQTIIDDPKIMAHMGIIYNGPGNRNTITDPLNEYDGQIGIELRGNMTKGFDKKPFTIETKDSEGNNLNVSLLGMPKENDWILSASYLDKTFIRDPLAYHMSRLMGNWASRTVHCELFLNDIYQGIYILLEQIKPDKNRVNITKMSPEDNSGEEVTGGYIYEVAQGVAGFGERRRFKYPKRQNITPEQRNYIRNYDDSFREIMAGVDYADPEKGYAAWIDVDSFVDEVLVQEACKNSDAYGWSSYFHKDRSEKLKAGPAWDFDQSLSNSIYNNGHIHDEWVILSPDHNKVAADNHPTFWRKLFEDKNFQNKMSIRWTQLRNTVWKTELIYNYIDSLAASLHEAQERNFETWQILGKHITRSTPGADKRDTYQKEVDYLKEFVQNRLNWMDEQLYDESIIGNEPDNEIITGIDSELPGFYLKNYSNPFSDKTIISYSLPEGSNVTLELFYMDGRSIQVLVNDYQPANKYSIEFNAQHLADGIYFYRLTAGNKISKTNKMIIRR